MPFSKNKSAKIFYEVKGEGKPLVLLHDIFYDHTVWGSWLDELSKHFQVVTVDLRGMGQSVVPKKEFTIKDMAKDVSELLTELEIDSFYLLGDSFGAAVAQTIAKENPERVSKLILSAPFMELSKVVSWALDIICELFSEGISSLEAYKMFIPWNFSARAIENEDAMKELLSTYKNNKHQIDAKSFKLLIDALKKFNSANWAKKITCPTLIMIAEDDIFTLFKDSRSLVRKIEGNQVELFPGGHDIFHDCPNRYKEVVKAFLNQE